MKGKLATPLLFFILIVLLSVPAYASTTKTLKQGKTYKSLDFNGDGKKDSFKYKYDGRYGANSGKATITLNGRSQKIFAARGLAVNYYKYSRKQIYLFIYTHQYGGGTMMVYRYKGNKLVKVNRSLAQMASPSFHHASGKYVYLEESPYHQNQIASLKEAEIGSEYGYITSFLVKYKLNTKKRKISLASRYADTLKPYPLIFAGTTFTTSSSPTSINSRGLVLHNGDYVELVQAYFKKTSGSYPHYKLYLKVRSNNQSGWFESSTSVPFV